MTMKNNEHLVPVIIHDMINGLHDSSRRETERDQLRLRLQSIRDYCDWHLVKYDAKIKQGTQRKR